MVGKPTKAVVKFIDQMHPVFDEKDSKAVADVVSSGWVSEGKLAKEFEKKVASVMGYRFGVATVNGTVALTLALIAANPFNFVEIPDLTFIATANAVLASGADVAFRDVKKPDFLFRGGIRVHLNGRDSGQGLVSDSAQALGSAVSLSKAASLSFAPSKIITTGQGGMVVTDDEQIAEDVRRLKDHGRLDKEDFYPSIGFDFKFTDIQAALGLSQFSKLPQRIEHKKRICRIYQEELRGLGICGQKKGELLLWQDILLEERDVVAARLEMNGIQTRKFYIPLHKQPAYATSESFPVAEKISSMGLWLPSSSDLTDEEVLFVCQKVKEAAR